MCVTNSTLSQFIIQYIKYEQILTRYKLLVIINKHSVFICYINLYIIYDIYSPHTQICQDHKHNINFLLRTFTFSYLLSGKVLFCII